MPRVNKAMVLRAVDFAIDAFVKSINKELDAVDAPEQQTSLPDAATAKGQAMQRLISHYVSQYREKMGPKARPDVGGKSQGALKRLMQDFTEPQVAKLISTYLKIDDPFFKGHYYDLTTLDFRRQQVLAVITASATKPQDSETLRVIADREQREKGKLPPGL